MKKCLRALLVLAAICVSSNTLAQQAREGYPPEPVPLAIEHVTVLPMTANGTTLSDMTVVLREGQIVSITPSRSAGRISGVKRINGKGKWLMPGLTDMHIHLDSEGFRRFPGPTAQAPRVANRPGLDVPYLRLDDQFAPYLANGVIQLLELQATSESVGIRVELESGRVLGPHLFLGAMVDGSPPTWPYGSTRVATNASDARQVVRDIAAEGYDFVKPYGRLDLDTFTALVDEARKHGIRAVGHIPQRGKGITGQFFQPGFDLVSHAEEFAQQAFPPAVNSIPEYVEMMKRHGTWLIATLTVDVRILEQVRDPEVLKRRTDVQYLSPGKKITLLNNNPYLANAKTNPRFGEYLSNIVDFNAKLIPAFVAAGIPILAGTDSGIPGIVPGFSLHDELVELSRAGLTNQQVLESATRLPSEWLGVGAVRGTVEAGKSADLLLLDANPLEDVRNARRISAVIVRGHYLPRADLDRRLQGMLTRYERMEKEIAERAK